MFKIPMRTGVALTLLGLGASNVSLAGAHPQLSAADATRFLEQASFGPTTSEVAAVQKVGFSKYLDQQFAIPPSGYSGYSYLSSNSTVGCPTGSPSTCYRDNYTLFYLQAQFFTNALTGGDQLRQRVAWALSQILVTSGFKINQPYAMAAYQQILLQDAFANYRTLLNDVTLSPAMGHYLDMVNNAKANPSAGTSPNENYAREVMQLFSLGPSLLNADGTPQLDADNNPLPTYTQDNIESFANVYTGWTYPTMPGATAKWTNPTYFLGPMVAIESYHDTTAKTLLNGVTVPAGGTAAADLKIALDDIFNHPNVGPFIGKQLIQHLVTSNPSKSYVQRVAKVFDDNGQGVRGDMQAVIKQILIDPEARGAEDTHTGYGKLREPALFLAGMLRTVGGSSDGEYLQQRSAAIEQNVFDANSVFSFYPPNYPLTGTHLTGPSFGIYDATSTLNRANVVNSLLASTNGIAADSTMTGATGTKINFSSWEAAASDPATLVDQVNQQLFHGAMPADMVTLLIGQVTAVSSTDVFNRARIALYLALTSSQYQVEQ